MGVKKSCFASALVRNGDAEVEIAASMLILRTEEASACRPILVGFMNRALHARCFRRFISKINLETSQLFRQSALQWLNGG